MYLRLISIYDTNNNTVLEDAIVNYQSLSAVKGMATKLLKEHAGCASIGEWYQHERCGDANDIEPTRDADNNTHVVIHGEQLARLVFPTYSLCHNDDDKVEQIKVWHWQCEHGRTVTCTMPDHGDAITDYPDCCK